MFAARRALIGAEPIRIAQELAVFADNWPTSEVADALRAFLAPPTTKAPTTAAPTTKADPT